MCIKLKKGEWFTSNYHTVYTFAVSGEKQLETLW